MLSYETPYRQLTSALLQLANTVRHDIADAVNYLSKPLQKPTTLFWKAAKHVLRYLEQFLELVLSFRSE